MERIDRIEKAIEELVASQKKTEELLAITEVQQAKTEASLLDLSESRKMVDQKFAELASGLEEMRKSMSIQSAELASGLEEMRKSMSIQSAELASGLEEMRKSMSIQSAELAASQKEMQRQLGGIGNTNGEFAENFFYSSLSNKMQLGGVKFDYIERNVKRRVRNLTDEFDIVLYNGDSVGLLEIKNTVKAANVAQLLQSKLQNFRTLNPEYANAKIYLGIGGFTFDNESVKDSAKAAGIIVLEVQGDHFEADVENMRVF